MDVVNIVLTLVIVGVVVWGALQILAAIPMQETFKTVARVIIIVAAVFYLLQTVFGQSVPKLW